MKQLALAALLLLSACATEIGAPSGPVLAQAHWQCPGGKNFGVRFVGDSAEVRAGGQIYRLPHARAASGARYANDRVQYWEHAGEATLTGAAGGPYEHCRH